MNIVNMKFLNKNIYNSVLISDNAVTYNCDKEYKTEDSSNKFTNYIKKMTDEEKRSEIFNHYLRNTKVISIEQNETYRGRNCIKIDGTRVLRTYLPIKLSDQTALLNKYRLDRLKTVQEEKYDKVHITISQHDAQCYLFREKNSDKELSLNISLIANDKGLLNFEREFLEQIIPFFMGTKKGKRKNYYDTQFGFYSWIGDGISDINHDIICSKNSLKIVYEIWQNEVNKRQSSVLEQITIEDYVKKLK